MSKASNGGTSQASVPGARDPRRERPVKFTRAEVEGLFDQNGELLADHLLTIMGARIDKIERSNLSQMAKIEATLPLEETLLRMVTMRQVLGLLQQAAEWLHKLDQEDADDQFYHSRRRKPETASPAN